MTRNRSTLIGWILAASAALGGCWTSPAPSEYPPARSSRGAAGLVFLANGRVFSGELLSVRDSSVVILVDERVSVAYFRDISRLSFAQFAYGEPGSREWPSIQILEQGRAVSRFPFGIGDAVMRALLDRRKQTAPDNLLQLRP